MQSEASSISTVKNLSLFLLIVFLNLSSSVTKAEECPKCSRYTEKKCVGGEMILDEVTNKCKLPTEKIRSYRPIPGNLNATAVPPFIYGNSKLHPLFFPHAIADSDYLEWVQTNSTEEWVRWCDSKVHPVPIHNYNGAYYKNRLYYPHPTLCFKYIACWSLNGLTMAEEISCPIDVNQDLMRFTRQRAPTEYARCQVWRDLPHCQSEIPKVWGWGWDKSKQEHPCSKFENLTNVNVLKTVPDPSDCNKYFSCVKNGLRNFYPSVMFIQPGNCNACSPFDSWHCPQGKTYYDDEKGLCSLWSQLSTKRRTQCALLKRKDESGEDNTSDESSSGEDTSDEASSGEDKDDEGDTDDASNGKGKKKKDGSSSDDTNGKQTTNVNYQMIKMGRKMKN